MKIERVLTEDLQEILNLQKLAFQIQAEIYNDYSIPPMIQTLEEIENDFLQQTYLKAVYIKKIIGSVRAYQEKDTCYIGRLIVHPDFHNQGIGTELINKIESIFNDAKRYGLFTSNKSKKNLYLYKKLGYKPLKIKKKNENLQIVYLEKKK